MHPDLSHITNPVQAADEYLAAEAALDVSRRGSLAYMYAQEVVHILGPVDWKYPIECMGCAATYTLIASTKEIASWQGPPRGLCAKCVGGKETAVIEV